MQESIIAGRLPGLDPPPGSRLGSMPDYGRVRHEGRETWVMVDGARLVPLPGPPWDHVAGPPFAPGGDGIDAASAEWLAPLAPSKIVGIGRNYALHAREHGVEVPKEPLLFLKAPSSVIAGGQDVVLPPDSQQVECEGELGVVIGRSVRDFRADGDPSAVAFGYVAVDDVTARDLQRADGQWSRGKSFDTFCPVARLIRTEAPRADAMLTTRFNGAVRQAARLSDMVFGVARIIAHVSAVMTLVPGDLILTGTPAGVAGLLEGDEVVIEIEGLPPLMHGVRKAGA